MFPHSSFLLMLVVGLSLSHLSSGQNWDTFQKKHLTYDLKINCTKFMNKKLFNCKPRNTFIYSCPELVKALCRDVAGSKNVLSHTKFNLFDCITNGKRCNYKSKQSTNFICITCEKGLPVHFVGVGSCKRPFFTEKVLEQGQTYGELLEKHVPQEPF